MTQAVNCQLSCSLAFGMTCVFTPPTPCQHPANANTPTVGKRWQPPLAPNRPPGQRFTLLPTPTNTKNRNIEINIPYASLVGRLEGVGGVFIFFKNGALATVGCVGKPQIHSSATDLMPSPPLPTGVGTLQQGVGNPLYFTNKGCFVAQISNIELCYKLVWHTKP